MATTAVLNLSGYVAPSTEVKAYPKANWPYPARTGPSGDPVGSAAATANTNASGVVTFTGLTTDTEYWAHAGSRYVSFNTIDPPQVQNGEITDPSVVNANAATAGTTLGEVVKSIEVFDRNGTSLGFVPVYDEIT